MVIEILLPSPNRKSTGGCENKTQSIAVIIENESVSCANLVEMIFGRRRWSENGNLTDRQANNRKLKGK